MNIIECRNEITKYSHLLYEKGLVVANQGNISMRYDENTIYITPTNISKGDVSPQNIVTMDINGNVKFSDLSPSSEYLMHLAIYRCLKNIRAIIHSHPPYATSYSFKHNKIDISDIPEAAEFLKEVIIIPYFPAGTKDLANNVASKLKNDDGIIILERHGTVAFSPTLKEAFFHTERLEYAVKLKG
jgi:L-fuculose-phosphate aldolase